MDLHGIGYSNIRLPNDQNSYIYTYDSRANTFPEEVFIHEFLHSLERTLTEYEYDIPQLHDNEKYGYKEQRLVGLKQWYKDYMNKNIETSNGKIGLPEEIYSLKPAKTSDFQNSYLIKTVFKQPTNFIEEIQEAVRKVFNKINGK